MNKPKSSMAVLLEAAGMRKIAAGSKCFVYKAKPSFKQKYPNLHIEYTIEIRAGQRAFAGFRIQPIAGKKGQQSAIRLLKELINRGVKFEITGEAEERRGN